MPDKHRIPTVLNPSGDIVVPLIIPHDPQWTGLLLGVLITLEETEYYQNDPDFDNENAKVVAARWRDTTINPLIESIASGEGFAVKHTIIFATLDANKTRNNSAYADVPDFSLSHTFTKGKAKISISNIRCQLSVGNQLGSIRGTLDEGTRITNDAVGCNSTTARNVRWVGLFEGIPAGTHHIGLEFAASGGSTITLFPAHNMVVEIEEYD